jgi:DNA-binding FrmR family transcriptional regulator
VGYQVNIIDYGEFLMVLKKVTKKTAKKVESELCHDNLHQHPSHMNQKRRLSRVKGQLEGIDKMIDENRYCMDIINQIRAATSALKSLEKEVMHTHIKSCVKAAIESSDHFDAQEKIQEIMDFF